MGVINKWESFRSGKVVAKEKTANLKVLKLHSQLSVLGGWLCVLENGVDLPWRTQHGGDNQGAVCKFCRNS